MPDYDEKVYLDLFRLVAEGKDQDYFNIFDIGAYIGDYTNYCLEHLYSLEMRVHAFEPLPKAFKKLAYRFKDHEWVTVVDAAVGGGPVKCVEFQVSKEDERFSSLHVDGGDLVLNTRQESVDNYCLNHNIKQIDFLKIDTEGFELHVLSGADTMLRNKDIGFIQFEYGGTWSRFGLKLRNIVEPLHTHGYRLFRYDDRLIEVRDYEDDYQYRNYLAVNSDYLES